MKYIIIQIWGDRLLPILDEDGYLLEFDSNRVAHNAAHEICATEYRVLDIERFISEDEHSI